MKNISEIPIQTGNQLFGKDLFLITKKTPEIKAGDTIDLGIGSTRDTTIVSITGDVIVFTLLRISSTMYNGTVDAANIMNPGSFVTKITGNYAVNGGSPITFDTSSMPRINGAVSGDTVTFTDIVITFNDNTTSTIAETFTYIYPSTSKVQDFILSYKVTGSTTNPKATNGKFTHEYLEVNNNGFLVANSHGYSYTFKNLIVMVQYTNI